ncbi:MAG: dTMP kinase [Parcubacteria group bacterium]|nr:dTMP kinase [Parcubacteria group bacterium]MCR4342472.1 dTMP kinase [Patescibacteria group bacterium]
MKKGKFIVIEGGEGAGKGMVMAFLREKLALRDDVVFTREPGGTPVAEKIREVLMDKENKNTSVLAELFLFCSARAQHVDELVRPSLEAGKIVISDRFDMSTLAYQIYGRQRPTFQKIFILLNDIAKTGLRPDSVIYLDVDPVVGLERKHKSDEGHCTRFDVENLSFHERVRAGYTAQYKEAIKDRSNPAWFLVATTKMAEKEVKKTVWGIVEKTVNT